MPFCMSGGTDAKQFARLGVTGYGFSPLRLPPGFDYQELFHGVDERVPVDALHFGATLDAWRDWTEIDDADEARAVDAMLERRIAAGEMRWARERLADSGLSETVAAARYRGSMTTWQEAAKTRDADEIPGAANRGERAPR